MLQTLNFNNTEYVVIKKENYEELLYGDGEHFPADFVDKLMASENKIGVWREYRGMTMSALAAAAGVSQSYISDIENGKKDGSVKTIKAIARALNADIELII